MSNNLNIDQMVPAQDQKETLHNDANGQIDAAITELIDVAVDNTNSRTLTDDEYRRHFRFSLVGGATVPTGSVTVTVPAIRRGLFLVSNGLTVDATVEITGQVGASPVVASGAVDLLESDGTNVRRVTSGGASTSSGVDLFAPYFGGQPGPSVLMSRFMAPRSFTFPAGMPGSQAHAAVAATSQADFRLRVQGVDIAIMRFAPSGTVGTFIKASPTSVVAGDRIDVVSAVPMDATLADITFTFVGV